MQTLIFNIGSLVTISRKSEKYKTGIAMSDVTEIKNGAVLFCEKIEWIGTTSEVMKKLDEKSISPDIIIDAEGKTVLPGFIDSHTHIVFAGNRSDEFGRRLRGATYQEIAEAGGGIQATVKATRNASMEVLSENGLRLAKSAIKHGTTALEIKSGYGLDLETELKMLRAIRRIKEILPIKIRTTFLGAHDFPPEFKDNRDKYVDIICNEMLPIVAEESLADYCDAFVDKGYYTIQQAEKIFRCAMDLGLKIRMHADELADVDAAGLAADIGAVSADHLLFISDKNIDKLRDSGTVATLLPGTAYFIRLPYAPARKLIDSGAIIAIATDCNPGSCFTENMQNILSLSVINMKMTAEEALNAATINAAHSLDYSSQAGSIEVGKDADLILTDTTSYIDLFYHFGVNHVEKVWINGDLH